MIATITLTRHRSGFVNVIDKYTIGNSEHEGDAVASNYILPEGYSVTDSPGYPVILDPECYVCDIVCHSSGRPQLISRAGPITKQPVLTAAA